MDNISKLTTEDSAAEKLVGESDERNSSKDQKVEIKYMAESQNGETKIDIENLGTAFVGMGKEELMKFANDPFWVKMRWFLFILFWVLWFAMLTGAVAIIVLAPKCAASTPKEWYEQSPIYEVDVKKFKDGSDKNDGLKGIESRIEYFKDLGIETILMESVMKSKDNGDHVEDFMSVDPAIGTAEDFKRLITSMKEKGIHLLMSFVPNYSSDSHSWFLKSIDKEKPYTDYYVWAPSKGRNHDGQPVAPNNWLSVTGGSAWEWNEKRQEFYLHQFNRSQPDLNFHNKAVVQYFDKVFQYWMDLGVHGFHLDRVEYLFEDARLRNESIDNNAKGVTHDQYAFFTHTHTTHLPENIQLLKGWSNIIRNESGVLLLSGVSSRESGEMSTIAQLIYHRLEISAAQTASDLQAEISNNKITFPVWEWVCKDERYCVDEEFAKSLQIALLLLPGTAVIKNNEDFKLHSLLEEQWIEVSNNISKSIEETKKNGLNSEYSTFKALIEARNSPSITHGSMESRVLNTTVFVYSRIKSGNPGYLVALNCGDKDSIINLQELKDVSGEVTVVGSSSHFNNTLIPKNKVSAKTVHIPSKASIVLTFVPLKQDS